MSTKMKILSWFILLVLLLVPTGAVAAQGLEDGRIIVASTFTLESGDTLNGDLVVIGGAATIQEDAVVNGNAVLLGGSLVVNGEINGDVLVMGGSVILGDHAILHRDLTTLGASLVRADGAVVEGEIFNTATSYGNGTNGDHPIIPIIPDIPNIRPIDIIRINPFQEVGGVISRAIVLGLLAMLVAVLLPEPTRRVAQAAIAQPVISGGLGLLTIIVVPFALVAMVITLILIPVTPLLVIFVAIVALYGWIALGTEVGVRLSKGTWSMPLAAGLGTFLLTLVVDALASIPVLACVGWPALILLGIVALGAVFTSRFGTQVVLPAGAPAKVEPALAEEPAVPEGPVAEAPARKRRTKKEE